MPKKESDSTDSTDKTASSSAKRRPRAKATSEQSSQSSARSGSESSQSSAGANDSAPPWWHDKFTEETNPADVSSAASEAVRLAAAVASWANDTGLSARLADVVEQTSGGLRSAVRAATGESSGRDEVGEFSCESCPICQGMDLVAGVAPDAVPGLAVALDSLTTALRDAFDMVSERSQSSTVEHIDID